MIEKAQILTFARKRGRPKTNRPQTDTGTPETVMKRLLGLTTEVLDLFLERGIIDNKQHWCGIHLRWLYTLRYGTPTVRATHLSDTHYSHYSSDDLEDPVWRSAREKEYNDAVNILSKSGHAIMLMNICIYNERPKFLNSPTLHQISRKKANDVTNDIAKVRDGLDVLVKLWK